MKIKILIITVISIIILAILFLLCLYARVRFIDCYGKEIKEWKQNTLPFTIESKLIKDIKVNNEKYIKERIYKPGEYKVTIGEGLFKKEKVVKINEIQRNIKNEYHVFLTSATLQLLFVSMDIAKIDDLKGFLWTKQDQTLDLDYLKTIGTDFRISKNLGDINEMDIKDRLLLEVKEYIKEILQKDNNAYFNLYIDEYRYYLEQELFAKIGLDDSRYEVIIYSDGTLSYIEEYYSGSQRYAREYKIRKANSYDTYVREKEQYNNIVKGIKSNTFEYTDEMGSYFINANKTLEYDYLLISTLRDNVTYKLQFPELITFADAKVAEEMKNSNLEKIIATKQFEELTQQEKEKFFKIVKLNKEELDQKYFNNNRAKYLIITGTKPYYGKITQQTFERIINKVVKTYSDYVILYKPHPSALPDVNQENFLNSMGIKVLPGKMPMEVMMFVYPNLKLGGFASSLYMSADKGKTEFFFEKGPEDLVPPLDQMYFKIFSNAKFYN